MQDSTPQPPTARRDATGDAVLAGSRVASILKRILYNGFPVAARFKTSLRVGSGAATLAAFDGNDGLILSDGTLAGFLARDRADSTKYFVWYENGTVRLQTQQGGDLWLINATTGRGLSTQLVNYTAATDLMSATAITAATWTTLATVTGFTPANANSTIWVSIRGACNLSAAASTGVAGRVLIDGATAFQFNGGITGATGDFKDVIGGAYFPIGSFAASAHTIVVQVYAGAAATGYCRASTQSNFEFLHVDIWEVRS